MDRRSWDDYELYDNRRVRKSLKKGKNSLESLKQGAIHPDQGIYSGDGEDRKVGVILVDGSEPYESDLEPVCTPSASGSVDFDRIRTIYRALGTTTLDMSDLSLQDTIDVLAVDLGIPEKEREEWLAYGDPPPPEATSEFFNQRQSLAWDFEREA